MTEAPIKGKVGTFEFRLPDWLPPDERYQRRYVAVDPEGGGVISDEPGLHPERGIRLWTIRSWKGGEGEALWKPGQDAYRIATRVRPAYLGEGLELTRRGETIEPGDTLQTVGIGTSQGSLWTATREAASLDAELFEWDDATEDWKTPIDIGHAHNSMSIADGSGDGGNDTYVSAADGSIWKVDPVSGGVEHYAGSGTGDDFAIEPILVTFGGRLYALDQDDLYEIDQSTTNTRTLKAEPGGVSSDGFLFPLYAKRISVSDVGPVWYQLLNSGETYIWEYNVESDTQKRIGRLPVDYARPYDIYYANGFYFVSFRYTHKHTAAGYAYLYIFRGGQKAVVGPIRTKDDSLASTTNHPITIAGVLGDDLILFFDDVAWAYNLTSGGIHQIAVDVFLGSRGVVFGQELFGILNTSRYHADEYDTTGGTLSTGRFDFDYPALRKKLLNVGVITDPLPAGTSVTMKVAVDGGTPVALSGTHDTEGRRRFAWAASGPGSEIEGWEFELEIGLDTNDSTVTPTVRQIWATATGAAHRITWTVAVDCTRFSHKDIDDLNALAGATLTFKDPFQNRGSDSTDDVVVTVEEVITPERLTAEVSEQVHGWMRLSSRDFVGISGSS